MSLKVGPVLRLKKEQANARAEEKRKAEGLRRVSMKLFGFEQEVYEDIGFKKPWFEEFWGQSRVRGYFKEAAMHFAISGTGDSEERRAVKRQAFDDITELMSMHYAYKMFKGEESYMPPGALEKLLVDEPYLNSEITKKAAVSLVAAGDMCGAGRVPSEYQAMLFGIVGVYFHQRILEGKYSGGVLSGQGKPTNEPYLTGLLQSDAKLYQSLVERQGLIVAMGKGCTKEQDPIAIPPSKSTLKI